MLMRNTYTEIEYKPEALLKFLAFTRETAYFNFSHIVYEDGKHKVVHSVGNHRLWKLKVTKIKLMFEF